MWEIIAQFLLLTLSILYTDFFFSNIDNQNNAYLK